VSFGDAPVMRGLRFVERQPVDQQTINSAWVVLETEATLGKSLRQIADYAAMRGLAMVRPGMLDGSADRILDLFEPWRARFAAGADRVRSRLPYKPLPRPRAALVAVAGAPHGLR
jgi:hypothetical protein